MLHRLLTALLVTLSLLTVGSSARAATAVGVSIVNQALISYVDSFTGGRIEIRSNTSSVTVSELKRFELNRPLSIAAAQGSIIRLPHQLRNTGNVADTYVLDPRNQDTDEGQLDELTVYIDSNGNGAIDDGEVELSGAVTIQPDQTLDLLVVGRLSSGLAEGAITHIVLEAQSVDAALAPQLLRDEIVTSADARLSLTLQNSPECPVEMNAGDLVDYWVTASNGNRVEPVSRSVAIDGVAMDGVLLQLDLPEDLLLDPLNRPVVDVPSAVVVVQETGNAGNWISYSSWQGLTSAVRLGVLVPSDRFTTATDVMFAFSARLAPEIDAERVELFAGVDLDADGRLDVTSNSVCNTVVSLAMAVEATIRFLEPSLTLQRQGVAPEFAFDEQFSDAPVYRLAQASDRYRAEVDGVYIEMTATLDVNQTLVDTNGVRGVVVDLSSEGTGDSLKVLLQETTPGSQRYRSIRPVQLGVNLVGGGGFCPGTSNAPVFAPANYLIDSPECALASRADDALSVSFSLPEASIFVSDTSIVDPVSLVFDSNTLDSIAGATVTVLSGGSVALHPISDEPLVFVTDERGRYRLPRLSPGGDYSIVVEPPASHRFSSDTGPEQFSSVVVGPYAYGAAGFNNAGNGRFSIQVGEATPVINIPLDPVASVSLLRIEKSVAETLIEPGGIVNYRIVVSNDSDSDVSMLTVVDTPPEGFRYVPGTARLNASSIEDPSRTPLSDTARDIRSLHFDLGSLAVGGSHQLTYRMQATAAAVDGDGINTAMATGINADGAVLASQVSRVGIEMIRTGVLSNEAIIFGKVYVDSSCDGMQNQGEWPIAGVRLFLHDGTVVRTDEDGQYSLFGLKPGLHIVKIDKETIPLDLKLKPLDSRHGADPESRFVDLSNGDFHRADFATNCPQQNPDAVFRHLQERSASLRGDWLLDGQGGNNARKRALDVQHNNDSDEAPSMRMSTDLDAASSMDEAERALMGDAKELVSEITRAQAKAGTWLWPADEFSTDGRFMAVVRSGLEPKLYVNDVEIGGEQIGERLINRRENAEIIAWYGVSLEAGVSTVQVRAEDSFGNERVLAGADFKRPAEANRITLRAKQVILPADGGRTTVPVDIVITDANGYPASGVYFVTLDTTAGDFVEHDLQPSEPGVQRRVDNGLGKVHLRSSDVTGALKVVARTGTLYTGMEFVQVAASRPLIGAGLIELGGRWGGIDNHGNEVADIEEGFNLSTRAALFLKGHIKRDLQLTLAYDTDSRRDEVDVLRDPDAETRYVVRGDASRANVEAQSRSKLYLKLERERNSLLWGDYLTDAQADPIDLARVQRTLTGLKGVYDDGKTRVEAFAAEVSDARASEEIRGNGTAMLFTLSGAPIVTNSEAIELIVRSRDNPGLVLSTRPLIRNSDYTIDPITGSLSFSETIPSVDAELNPVFLRITYDRESNLEEHVISGVRVTHTLGDSTTIGASVTDDQNPISGSRIAGVHAGFQPSARTQISIAAAQQYHQSQQDDGRAQRFQLEHSWSKRPSHQTSITWAQADSNFSNVGSGIAAGRKEWRLTHTQPFSNSFKGIAEAIHSQSLSDGTEYTSTGLQLEKTLRDWTFSAGTRRIESGNAVETTRFTTASLGVDKRITIGSRAGSAGIDYEQDVDDASRYRLGLNLRAEAHEHVNLYSRYEYERGLSAQSLLGSQEGSTQFTLGVESDVLASTELYSEYRMRGSFSGQSMEAVSGARGRFEIEPGLTINPGAEYIRALGGENVEDAIALSLGVRDIRNPNRRVSGQAEVRESDSSRYLGLRSTIAQRLSVNWTGLLKEEFTRQVPRIGEMTLRHRFTVGLAHRPKLNNRHHMLLLANWNVDRGPADGADRTTFILSNHHNRQINRKLTLSGRAAGKWQTTHFVDEDVVSQAMLSDVRLTYDLNRRWEVDIRGGWLGTENLGEGRFSLGAGVHWLVDRNLRLGLAYNLIGFRDEDLDEQGYNAKGVHLGLQMKFDEDWFKWLAFGK